MATKEQERKALEQIRKIVEGLGENSYLSFAFEGCFEKKEQKKYNSKKPESTADTCCKNKGVIAFYGARGSTGEAQQAHELLAHR